MWRQPILAMLLFLLLKSRYDGFWDWIELISFLKFSFKFPYESRQSFYLLKKKKKWEIKRSEFRGHGKLEKTIFAGDWGVFRVRVRAVKNGSITVFPCAHVHKHEQRVGERFSASWPGPSFGDSQEKERRKGGERKRERMGRGGPPSPPPSLRFFSSVSIVGRFDSTPGGSNSNQSGIIAAVLRALSTALSRRPFGPALKRV